MKRIISACKEAYKEQLEVLKKYFKPLTSDFKGVLNVQVGTKIVDGKDTEEPSIIVYVAKKKPMATLDPHQVLPKELDGVKVDVVELSTDDFELGETEVSKLSPEHQLKLASGIKCKEK